MAEYDITEEWVDRYLRDELDDKEREAFELELMNSPELSQALAVAMGVQQALTLDEGSSAEIDANDASPLGPSRGWQTFAMAASLILAVFSTTMYWRTSTQASALESELNILRQPVGSVVTVPVEIMRSGGAFEPARAVAIPEEAGLILLDIEVPADHAGEPALQMRLSTEAGDEIMSWTSSPLPSGNHNAAIRADLLPRGAVVLEISLLSGDLIYRTGLEIR